ncbi:MAG: SRPBCC family protein [Chitinophagales bacterium]
MQNYPNNEIVSTRIFPAERAMLYKAWTDPEHLKNWWGPNGFTNTIHQYDLQPGGRWSLVMHSPDGHDYPNESVFLQVEDQKLISWDRITKPLFKVITTFEAHTAHETKVIFKMIFKDAEECRRLHTFIAEKNEENFDRLEVELQKMLC